MMRRLWARLWARRVRPINASRWRRLFLLVIATGLGLAVLASSIFYAILVGLRIARQATCLASRQAGKMRKLEFVAAEAASNWEPRYAFNASAPLPVWVLTLPGATARRANMTAQLLAQGIPFELVDGVDGAALAAGDSDAEELRDAYVVRGATALTPARQGCLLSHVRLLHRLVWEEAEIAVLLEDDALLAPGFIARLHAALSSLPATWHVLYLNTCESLWGWRHDEVGTRASPLLRHARRATCTVGMVVNDHGALRMLRALQRAATQPLDLEYIRVIRSGHIKAFIAEPPLVAWTDGLRNSTIIAMEDAISRRKPR